MDVCPVADVSGVDLQGDGIFRVTAGQMRIGAATQTLDSQTQFDLQVGELKVTRYATNSFMDKVCKIFVSGGVLDVDSHFQTSGAFSFTGGCIEVAPQKGRIVPELSNRIADSTRFGTNSRPRRRTTSATARA